MAKVDLPELVFGIHGKLDSDKPIVFRKSYGKQQSYAYRKPSGPRSARQLENQARMSAANRRAHEIMRDPSSAEYAEYLSRYEAEGGRFKTLHGFIVSKIFSSA